MNTKIDWNKPHLKLAVYSADLLLGAELERVKSAVEARFQSKAWLLGGGAALAVLPTPMVICEISPRAELEREREASGQVYTFLREFEGERSPKAISVPNPKFSIIGLFPRSEEAYLMSLTAREMETQSPLFVNIHLREKGRADAAERIEAVFEKWLQEATTTGFCGEVVQSAKVESLGLQTGKRTRFLAYSLGDTNAVTFPWLELFFRLRAEFKKTQRPLGISFSNR